MRIALVIERFEPRGGVESVSWNVARGLAEAQDEVHVFARQATSCPGVEIHRLRVPRFWQPLRVLAFSHAAARETARERFDVVHSFSRTLHQDVYRAGGGSHADYLERSYDRVGGSLRRISPRHAVLLAIERRVFADPHQIVQCNSAMVQREISDRYGVPEGRLVVVENGVDLERFHPDRHQAEGEALRHSLAAKDRTIWLFAGSGFRRKGLDTALRALAAHDSPEVELWVAGGDPPQPWVAQSRRLGVEGRVRFLGPRDDLEIVYAAVDVVFLPTRYDAFANVCLEAAAAGLPVVTSSSNGAADFVKKAGGLVASRENVEGFVRALAPLSDPALRKERGAQARRHAESRGWAAHVASLRDLYRQVRS